MNFEEIIAKLPKPYYRDDAVVIYHADCRDILPLLSDIDAVITDPPYGLGFMNKEWDNPNKERELIEREKRRSEQRFKEGKSPTTAPFSQSIRPGLPIKGAREGKWFQKWCEEWAELCLEALKPGGHLLSFGATRTYHRMACAIEDAGFEIRDMINWIYGSGFPKSLNIGKAIDKLQGNERELIGKSQRHNSGEFGGDIYGNYIGGIPLNTKGNSEWEGWGTALKPAHEPIVLARKPLSEKTVAENVLKYGTGAININGCRVGTEPHIVHGKEAGKFQPTGGETIKDYHKVEGRFPANLIHDGSDEVLAVFPEAKSSGVYTKTGINKNTKQGKIRTWDVSYDKLNTYGGDTGSAARFFYCAKASRSERDAGLDGIELQRIEGRDAGQDERNVPYKNRPEPQRNQHPTVKPLALMRYLITLITPPSGIILDPFMGSGSTVLAAKQLGFKCIGIEIEEAYCRIAAKRLSQSIMALNL